MVKKKRIRLKLFLEEGLPPSDYVERDVTSLDEFMSRRVKGAAKENGNKNIS